MFYKIVPRRGYFEIHDQFGKFVCSGDTEIEALKELENMEHEWELD